MRAVALLLLTLTCGGAPLQGTARVIDNRHRQVIALQSDERERVVVASACGESVEFMLSPAMDERRFVVNSGCSRGAWTAEEFPQSERSRDGHQ